MGLLNKTEDSKLSGVDPSMEQTNEATAKVDSFFEEIENQIKKRNKLDLRDELLNRDLLNDMENHYNEKKFQSMEIKDKLKPIQKLEEEWKMLQQQIEKKRQELIGKEKELHRQIESLQNFRA